ncbi:MAG: AAA family ATPase, partial [Lachnospiraceae bacterium]|nr:AAA family ATPase [Lachnospiraceae bacterium]
ISNENAFPTAAWSNTSSNSIVKDLIGRASKEVQDEVEKLVNGGTIEKKVHEDIAYEDIYATEDMIFVSVTMM